MIANTIIKSALRKLLVTPSGGTPTASQYADGLEALNDFVRYLSASASTIYEDTLEEIAIAFGTQSFTLGGTGDYVTGKPVEILYASIKDGDTEYPLDIIDDRIYQNVQDKSETGMPEYLYFRNTIPNSTLYFDVTTDKAYTLILSSNKELTEFPDGTTDVALPSYYETCFKQNLPIVLAPEFGAANRVTPIMLAMAEASFNAVVGKSVRINTSKIEVGSVSGGDRNTDL